MKSFATSYTKKAKEAFWNALHQQHSLEEIEQAFQALPVMTAEVLRSLYAERRSVKETALILGRCESIIRKHQHTGVAALCERFTTNILLEKAEYSHSFIVRIGKVTASEPRYVTRIERKR